MHKLLHITDGDASFDIGINSITDIHNTADKITNIIMDKYEKIMIDSLLKSQYTYLEKTEQTFTGNKSKENLNKIRTSLKEELMSNTIEYISKESEINIGGFITFRLQQYVNEIENAVDSAVNFFVVEREYSQLIDGLTLYIELQVPMIDSVVITQDNDKYIVADGKGEVIFTLIHYDDVLLDVILTLAPRRIEIINYNDFKNKELLDTITQVFSKRVVFIDKCKNV